MAIPDIPSTNFYAQTGNGQNYVSWDLVPGATSYSVERSTDGVTYAEVATPAVPEYLDTSVTLGTQYYYKAASVNASGTSPYTIPQAVVPTPSAEMSLGQLRYLSQEKADMVGSNFVTKPEWNTFIGLAMYELYDLLVDMDPDRWMTTPAQFNTNGSQYLYPLPDGSTSFTNSLTNQSFIAAPFYRLMGADLGLQTSNNGWVTIDKFNFISRNQFVYPNTASTIYGVFNMRYRLIGANIEFIPTPSANQPIRLWYVPRLPQLLKDTDITTLGTSGWLQYVIVRAAKYALDKQERDTSKLDQEIVFLKERIEAAAQARDTGRPDTISNVRSSDWFGNSGSFGGNSGGF